MPTRFLLPALLLLAIPVRADDQKAREENLKLREEIVKLRESLVQQERKALELAKQVEDTKRQAVAAGLEQKALRARAEMLLLRVQELEKEITRLKAGAPAVPPRQGARNFPTENIEGKVKRVGADGLLVLSVGSDAGLLKGHHLQLYRLDPMPEKSKYLGVVLIIEVRAAEAVARPVGKLPAPVQPGDRVASQLIGEEKK